MRSSQRTLEMWQPDEPRTGYLYISKPKAEVHRVRAQVRDLRERGYIAEKYRMAEIDGLAVAEVLPLRPLPKPMKLRYKVMACAAMGLGAASGLGYLLWMSRWVILVVMTVAAAIALLLALAAAGASSKGCTGVHVKH